MRTLPRTTVVLALLWVGLVGLLLAMYYSREQPELVPVKTMVVHELVADVLGLFGDQKTRSISTPERQVSTFRLGVEVGFILVSMLLGISILKTLQQRSRKRRS